MIFASLCLSCSDDAKRSDPGKSADAGDISSDASTNSDAGPEPSSDASRDEPGRTGEAPGDAGAERDPSSGGTSGAAQGAAGTAPKAGAGGAGASGANAAQGGAGSGGANAAGAGDASAAAAGGTAGSAGSNAGGASGAAAGGAGAAGADAGGASGAAAGGAGGSAAGAGGASGAAAGGMSGSAGNGGAGAGGASGQLCASCGGCEQLIAPSPENPHTTDPITYPDPPPTSGPHNPCWARYTVHDTPARPERWVHNLEHGGVVFLYNCPDGCPTDVATLTNLVSTRARTVLTAYSDLPGKFAVVSWGHRLVADCVDPVAFASFYDANFDHGDESEPADPDPACPPDDRLQ